MPGERYEWNCWRTSLSTYFVLVRCLKRQKSTMFLVKQPDHVTLLNPWDPMPSMLLHYPCEKEALPPIARCVLRELLLTGSRLYWG